MAPPATPNAGKADQAPAPVPKVAPRDSPSGLRGFTDEQITLGDKTLSIQVGLLLTGRKFLVHESVILKGSNYFFSPYKRNLPKQYMRGFEIYVQYAYTRRLLCSDKFLVASNAEDSLRDEIQGCCHLFILADHIGDRECKNAAITGMIEAYNESKEPFHPDGKPSFLEIVKFIYNNKDVPADSLLRRVLVDMFNKRPDMAYLESKYAEFPEEFKKEVTMSSLRSPGRTAGHKLDPQDYHIPKPEPKPETPKATSKATATPKPKATAVNKNKKKK